MHEASKTLKLLTDDERSLLHGIGIDIGCGDDPVCPDAQPFDLAHGDANRVTDYGPPLGAFDYVFSSHCLEHMRDPGAALADWWRLVKPGGVMIIVVPDEDLYEQGYWPSVFNPDHKHTFSIAKSASWSPVACSLAALAAALSNAEILTLRRQDAGYDRPPGPFARWPRLVVRVVDRSRARLVGPFRPMRRAVDGTCRALGIAIDQTIGDAVAQNLLIVRKSTAARQGERLVAAEHSA